uniref:Uncharacterized protein n=1 Tax=Lepeophtheirus salmonis TaxID=72036 RepID=A0A0K2U099_LEPSM
MYTDCTGEMLIQKAVKCRVFKHRGPLTICYDKSKPTGFDHQLY